MSDLPVYDLSRDTLVRITNEALAAANVSDDNRERAMEIANSEKYFAVNTWDVVCQIGECGCLVGWMAGLPGDVWSPDDDDTMHLSLVFDDLLKSAIQELGYDNDNDTAVVRVT